MLMKLTVLSSLLIIIIIIIICKTVINYTESLRDCTGQGRWHKCYEKHINFAPNNIALI